MKLSNFLSNIRTKASEKLNNLKSKLSEAREKSSVQKQPVLEKTDEDTLQDIVLEEANIPDGLFDIYGNNFTVTPQVNEDGETSYTIEGDNFTVTPYNKPVVSPRIPIQDGEFVKVNPDIQPIKPPENDSHQPLEGYKYISNIKKLDSGLTVYTLTNGVKITLDSNQEFNEEDNVQISDSGAVWLGNLTGGKIEGTENNDNITLWNSTGVKIEGKDGDDSIWAFGSKFIDIDGGSGDDMINTTNSAAFQIKGGDGNDIITSSASSNFSIDAGDGDDTMNIMGSDHFDIDGGSGKDVIKYDLADAIEHINRQPHIKFEFGSEYINQIKTAEEDINNGTPNNFRVYGGDGNP